MRFTREQYIEIMTFGPVERPMFVELFGLLVGLEDEWRAQGATQEEIDLVAFDWDYVEVAGCGAETGLFGAPETVLLEETDQHVIQRDGLGRTVKLCKGAATIGLPLDFPVKTMDDWLALKPLYTFDPRRIDEDQIARARQARARGALVRAGIGGGFDTARELMGEEVACLAYYEQPELMHDILDTLRETALAVLQRVTGQITVDQLSVHEDMAGKSGPLIGPKQIEEYLRPYYRACWDLVSSRGGRIFDQDSDGNMNPVVDAFLDCGLTAMHPFEPAAGMDMVQSRERYGRRLAIKGGIDKHVLRGTKADIRRELEYKLQPRMREGGTVFGLDHRIPNGTPLEHYRYYVDTGREILGLPPRDGRNTGWRRMAF